MRNTSTNKNRKPGTDPNPETPHVQEVASHLVLKLSDGRTILLNMAPLAEMFDDLEIERPIDLERKFTQCCDNLVTGYGDKFALDLEEMQESYHWLKKCRDVFKQITWREVSDELAD